MNRRHYIFSIFLGVLLFFGVSQNTHIVFAQDNAGDQYIVTFQEKINYPLLKEAGADINIEFDMIPSVAVTINKEGIEKLIIDPSVKWLERDRKVMVESQQVTLPYKKVLAPEAKKAGWTGQGIKVGVIDTGINGKHPDLKLAGGQSFIPNSPYNRDWVGHGTHMAGIIAALDNQIGTLGVAPNVELYSIKALGDNGEGTQSTIAQGVEWATQNKMDVINLSLTTKQDSKMLREVFDKAYKSGILIVAAAGNKVDENEQFSDVLFPARFSSVISVCSVNDKLALSWFSYYGPSQEICAVGENVYSTSSNPYTPTSEDYSSESGTSAASAFVSGVLALYKQAYPDMSNSQIRKIMQTNAQQLGGKVKTNKFGYGLVQAPGSILTPFTDIKSTTWYTKEVNYLSAASIINGYPDRTFKPDKNVTRAEMAVMVGKALKLPEEKGGSSFSDTKGNYAEGYINALTNKGIIKGFPNGTFQPDKQVKRADVALMIKDAFEYEDSLEPYFTDVKIGTYYFSAVHSLRKENISNGYPDRTFKPDRSITRSEVATLIARALNDEFKTKQ